MKTIGECVGGACDGVQLDPHDKQEPDDWPDYIEVCDKQTGVTEAYYLRLPGPKIRNGKRVYFYDYSDLVE